MKIILNKYKSVLESFFSLSILNGLNVLLPLVTLPYILRVIGSANYGTYAYVRKRSQCLLLSHQKRTIIDLSKVFDVNRRTIERWFDSWVLKGVESLSIEPGRGVKNPSERV